MAGLTRDFNFTPLFPSRSLDAYILGVNFPIKDDVLFVKKSCSFIHYEIIDSYTRGYFKI